MIARKFEPPNFRVDATEEDGPRRKWVTRGHSEADLTQRLTEDGWTVHSVRPYNFSSWLARSEELLEDIEAARSRREKPVFSETHYQALKRHLFDLFNGKCAYCEAFARHIASGDVEHYRPKRAVTDEKGHPGYYWLAYDVENLLPACELCNRAGAKMNKFPVETGTRAMDPADIANEVPLLLNPYLDPEPVSHLCFLSSGHVGGRTEKGKRSVSTYRLNRKELRLRRENCIAGLHNTLKVRLIERGSLKEAASSVISELAPGTDEYAAAQLSFVRDWLDEQLDAAAAARAMLPSALREAVGSGEGGDGN